MKKFLSIVALSMLLLIPLGAKAMTIQPIGSSCEKDTECPDDDGYCYATCGVKITGNTTSLNAIEWQINVPTGVEVVEVNATPTGATVASGTSTSVNILFGTPITDSEFNLATYRIKYTKDVDCSHTISLNGVTTNMTVETTTTVSTGASLPIVIIACGVAAVGVIYIATKKNKKMYKI